MANVGPGSTQLCRTLIFLTALVALLLFAETSTTSHPSSGASSSDHHLRLSSGRTIPLHLLTSRLPHLPLARLPNAVFELVSTGDVLHSLSRTIDVNFLAPEKSRLVADSPITVHEDQLQLRDIVTGPYVRRGHGYTFVFDDESGVLIASWGPNLLLEPLSHAEHPGLFVNKFEGRKHLNAATDAHRADHCEENSDDSRGSDTEKSCRENAKLPTAPQIPHDPHTYTMPSASFLNPATQRMIPDQYADVTSVDEDDESLFLSNSSEHLNRHLSSKHDFDIFVAYDHSFCQQNNGSRFANKIVQALYDDIRLLFRETRIHPNLKSIQGHCDPLTDPFLRPKSLGLDETSGSSTILRMLRNYWGTERDMVRRDAVYLITGYEDGTDAIGAAYVGAACNTEYGYGWVQHAHSVVFAHEMAHTLGAYHDGTGIMRPFLDVGNETIPTFSESSVLTINEFIKSIWSSWCLARWDQYYRYGDSTLVGLKMGKTFVDGSDVTFGDNADGGKNLYVLHLGKKNATEQIYYSVTRNVKYTETNRYRYGSWRGLYAVPHTSGSYPSGGGIAFGNLKNGTSRDLLVFYVKWRTVGFYKVGFGLDEFGEIQESSWSRAFRLPERLGEKLKCSGATIGDVLGVGKKDLVIVYIDSRYGVDYGLYMIGWDLGMDGEVRGGWSDAMHIPGWFGYRTGDISVALADTTSSGKTDLVIHSNEKVMMEWRGVFRVGRDMNRSGVVSGLWSTSIPAPGSPLVAVMPGVTGGIAVDRVPGRNGKLTTAILQSVVFAEARAVVSYMEFGFDLADAAQADANGSFVENVLRRPMSSCGRCYGRRRVPICEGRFEKCELKAHEYPIETDIRGNDMSAHSPALVRGGLSAMTAREAWLGGYGDDIACAGFYALFLGGRGDACRSNVGTEDVVSAGAAEVLREVLRSELRGVDGAAWAMVYHEVQTRDVARMVVRGETWGPTKAPLSVRLTFKGSKELNMWRIRAAIQQLASRRDYAGVFKAPGDKMKVVAKGGSVFIVILQFEWTFTQDYYKEDVLVSYGTDAVRRRK